MHSLLALGRLDLVLVSGDSVGALMLVELLDPYSLLSSSAQVRTLLG